MSDHVLSDILDWFWEIEEWIPGIHSTVGEIIFGPIPLSDGARLYDLAEAWGEVANGLAEAYEEVRPAADSIIEAWSGDAAAMQFAQQWMSYLEALRTTADSVSSMQQGVQGLALQVEMMKFMAVINLIMLAVSLYIIIAALIPSAGTSMGGVPPALAACRTAMWAAVRKIVQAITGITFRTALKGLGQFATRALPAAVRAAPRVLPTVVRAVPRAATTTGRGLGTVARNTFTRLTPRNVVARTVADRLAGQAMNRAARTALRNQLGRGLGSRAAANAARSQVARELQQQILVSWGARTAAQAAGRTAANSAARYAGNQMLERAVQQGLARAATEATEVAFRRELAKYLGIRVAFGAGFLGGGDLLGQGLQVLDGNRSGIDMTQTAVTAAQGAAFGLGMWGGLGGHILGGAAAGGMVGLGTAMASEEGFDWRDPDDWAKVGHEAAKGGMAGAIFGAQNNLEMVRVNAPSRIGGADIRTLPDSLAAGSRTSGGLPGGLAGVRSGEGFAPGLGDGVGSLPDGDGIGLRRDGESAPRAPEAETPRGVVAPALPVVDALTRGEALPARGGDGGAGPGPRQPATPAPSGGSSPRAADQVRDEGGARPGTIERTPVPVEPLRVGDDAPPPRDPDAPGRGGDEFVPERDHEGYFPDRTGEDLEIFRGRENLGGDPARFSEDQGRQSGGRIYSRDPGEDGPPVGDREGVGTGEATGRGPEPPVLGRVREDSALSQGAEQVAGEGLVRGVAGEQVPYRLVPVEPVPTTRVAEVPDAVAAVIDQHVTGLLDGRNVDVVDQPHRAMWNPESGTLTVRYPDGLEARVVLQVNSSLPPGHPMVLRPTMEFVHGAWRQADAAGVILPAHAPADPMARAGLVQRELGNAWSTLHNELRDLSDLRPPADGPSRQDGTLAGLEEGGPDAPVLGPERVTFLDTTPAVPLEPSPLAPEAVQRMLADPMLAEPVVGWVRDNLAVRTADGTYLPRSADEIAAAIAQLQAEAARAVGGPEPATPRDITASRVERSQFHGYGRPDADPAAVLRVGQEALDGAVNRLPGDAPLRGLRLGLTAVPADSLPQRAVARSVPVDDLGNDLPRGTVPSDGGGYRIEVSDRASEPAIRRGMAHEVSELSATLHRAAEGLDRTSSDVLRPGEFIDGSQLSPHDVGRLAEIEELARILSDPRHAGYAHAEIGALREHLGLRPEDPGAAGRRGMVDPNLSPEARAALDNMGPPRDGAEPYKLSEAENERIFRDLIVPERLAGRTSQEQPVVVFVGGQTGAGKTAITNMIKNALATRGEYINVNMDYYNPHHPAMERLQAADETTASAYVRPDGDVWWDKAQNYAIANRNDVVLETAMRTPAEFESIAAKFKAAGYRVETAIVAVPEASSRLGVLDRYWSEFTERGVGRYVEQASHDATYNGVIRAARALDATHLSDQVFVFRRGGEQLYSNHLTPEGQWARPPATAEAVQAERTRTWTATEEQWFIDTVERLRGEIASRYRAEVDQIAELGRPLSPTMQAAETPQPALPAAPEGGTPARAEVPPPETGPPPETAPPQEAGRPADSTPAAADPTSVLVGPAHGPGDPTPAVRDPAQVPPTDPGSATPGSADVVNALRGEQSSDYLPFDRSDLDPNPRPDETPEQAADRVETAEAAMIYNDLGPEPPRINLAEHDATYGAHGAHTVERHDSTVPLHRDPTTRTIEGRIYGDPPWPGRENFSYRWLGPSTMNRTINEYLQQNWAAIREDLALNRYHKNVINMGRAIGEGFYNRTGYQPGQPVARYHVTSMMSITLRMVPGSDPAQFFIITVFPTGRGF
ncbi:zeta toxin family protein [Solwaraspora sp. WMMB762]|uniref:zeta toxin family protein n=1 Tax=Solwaraspora sp. WMMB762 TaxID=3404120 RepID=UPI003B95BD73